MRRGLVGFARLVGCVVMFASCTRKAPSPAVASLNVNPPASSASARAPASLPEAAEPEVPLSSKNVGWEANRAYVYALQLTSQVAFGPAGSAIDFDLSARVLLSTMRVAPTNVLMRLELTQARFTSRVPGTQAEFEKTLPEFEKPYYFVLTGNRVTEIRFTKDLDPLACGILRTISAALQFVRPVTPVDQWTASEYDATGRYVASYTRLNASEFQKRKRRYVSLLSQKTSADHLPEGFNPVISSSSSSLTLAETGRPLRISSNEEVVLDGAQAQIRSKTHVQLEALPQSGDVPARVRMPSPDLLRLPADEAFVAAIPAELMDNARVGGLAIETIVRRLEAAALSDAAGVQAANSAHSESNSAQTNTKLFGALVASFRTQPDTVGVVLQRIRAGSAASQTFIDALASSGSPAAQDALIGLASSPGINAEELRSLVFAISRIPSPTEASVRLLSAFLDREGVGTQALYGLGTFARLLRDAGQTERANAIGLTLLDRLEGATSEQQIGRCLRALANAGHAPALTRIRTFLDDSREEIRADALRALRSMASAEVDAIVAARLRADASELVRTAALEVTSLRGPTPDLITAVEHAALAAREPHVRYRATQLLRKWLPEHAPLRGVLRNIAASDSEDRIRKLAHAAL